MQRTASVRASHAHVSAHDTQPGRVTIPLMYNLPALRRQLTGANEVRIRNPNDFTATAAVRIGDSGVDIDVPPGGVASAYVPDGRYDIYFNYSNQPAALFQGDSFTLSGNGVEIRIVQVPNGNYGIRQVR